MIDPDVEPMFNVSPYRRIDPMHPGRKARITQEEAIKAVMAGGKGPDMAIYSFDMDAQTGEMVYILKETL